MEITVFCHECPGRIEWENVQQFLFDCILKKNILCTLQLRAQLHIQMYKRTINVAYFQKTE